MFQIDSIDLKFEFSHPQYKEPRCDFRSPLMKTLDWSVETLGCECNSIGLCIHLLKACQTRMTVDES